MPPMLHNTADNSSISSSSGPAGAKIPPVAPLSGLSRAPHTAPAAPPPTSPTLQPSKWLDNKDLRPTPVRDRTWGPWTTILFWFAAAANLSNWYSPTSFMTVGLTMWEALGCHLVGQFIAGVTMALNGRGGAVYHIGFPVLARSSFGVVGAVWPVINRIVMSIIWNGVNLVQCGQAVYVMLHAIFPSIANLPNGMKSTDALNTGGMIGMTISWVVMVLCLWFIPIPKLKYYLITKVPVFAISAIAMLVWTLTLAGGLPTSVTRSRNGVVLKGSDRSWLLCRFILLSWANNSTFIVNAADLQRYTKNPNDAILSQIVGFPLSNFIIGLVGVIIGATSIKVIAPEATVGGTAGGGQPSSAKLVWNPIIYLDKIMTQNYTPANRAGAFFLALCFAYSGIFSCIVENLLPAGNDLSALWPKYLTIKRSFIVCALLTFACVPWKLLGTSSNFIAWLASYQIFLSSITGVMLCHYFLITGGLLALEPDLYTASKSGVAFYTMGCNPRAYIAYALGIAPNFYGFLGQVGVKITLAGTRYFYFAYPVGVFVSFTAYFLLSIMSPPAFTTIKFFEKEETEKAGLETSQNMEDGEFEKGRYISEKSQLESLESENGKAPAPISAVIQPADTLDNALSSSPYILREEYILSTHSGANNRSRLLFKRRGPMNRQKVLCVFPKFQLRWREPTDYISVTDDEGRALRQQQLAAAAAASAAGAPWTASRWWPFGSRGEEAVAAQASPVPESEYNAGLPAPPQSVSRRRSILEIVGVARPPTGRGGYASDAGDASSISSEASNKRDSRFQQHF